MRTNSIILDLLLSRLELAC